MPQFLCFNLYGAMASWGEIAVGEKRHSYVYPSKSAIMGMLAAALGIRRDEEEKHLHLQDSLGFAVCVYKPGELLRDFHTAQVPPSKRGKNYRTRRDELNAEKLNTILSQRDYQMDAYYLIVLWLKADDAKYTLQKLKHALLHPRFTLYLGRKSCPLALPLSPKIVDTDTLNNVVTSHNYEFEFLDGLGVNQNISVYWEDIAFSDSGFSESQLRDKVQRSDSIASRKRWQFYPREECFVSLPVTLFSQGGG